MSKSRCFWVGCTKEVPAKMLGCRKHWSSLPNELQARIWQTYTPGQEKPNHTTTSEYTAVLKECIQYSIDHPEKT